jgi:localization factor PodJL
MPTYAPKENFGARADAPANPEQDEVARLTQMRDRLVSLGNEARSMRDQMPSEFEGDVERIQGQMQRLGERLAELSRGDHATKATREVARVPTDEVILLGGPYAIDEPLDEASVNALTQIYESGEAFQRRAPNAGSSAMQQGTSGPSRGMVLKNLSRSGPQTRPEERNRAPEGATGQTWVNDRFAEIAQRIEQSLAAIRPDSSLLRLGHRFDHLEQCMTAVLSNVASKADLKELRIAEAQVEDIGAQLEQLRRQLARLDSIDSHINKLSERLSDEKLAGLAGPGGAGGRDEARLAAIDANVQALSARLSRDQLSEMIKESVRTGDQGDLRGLLENLINERRHNDENNASMLETMQQAIIRVLDRIDGLELAQQHGGGHAGHEQQPRVPLQAEVERFAAELQSDEPAYEVPPSSIFAQDSDETIEVPQSQFAAVPFDMETAFSPDERAPVYAAAPEASLRTPEGTRNESMRHDFIADAHRAKLKAATRLDSSIGSAGERSADAAAQQGTVKPRARRSIFNFRSPRVLMSILTLLAMIPAALFFMPRTPADTHTSATVKSALPAFFGDTMKSDSPAAKDAAPAMPNGNGASPAGDVPRKQSEQLNPGAPTTNAFGEGGSPAQKISYDRIDTASIPGSVTLGTGTVITASLTPTTPDAGLPANNVAGDSASAQPDNKPLSLPPVTVGPYSLRLAAARGDASAQFEVGVRLAEGKGADQDMKEALQWYQRSAGSGFAMAQFRLGTLYERGLGVKADVARARIWYTRAAQQGNVKATHNLAVLLAGRGGATPDYPQAAKLFGESASHGLTDSQFNLAMLYESGLGVPRDLKEAYKWLLLASRSGDKEAATHRDALKLQLSEADRAVAEASAKSFRAKPVNPIANDFRAAGQAWRPGASSFARQG